MISCSVYLCLAKFAAMTCRKQASSWFFVKKESSNQDELEIMSSNNPMDLTSITNAAQSISKAVMSIGPGYKMMRSCLQSGKDGYKMSHFLALSRRRNYTHIIITPSNFHQSMIIHIQITWSPCHIERVEV